MFLKVFLEDTNTLLKSIQSLVYRKKTLGFPNQGERYGAKYENGKNGNPGIFTNGLPAMKNPDALRIFFP
jgi:hypothetical protein